MATSKSSNIAARLDRIDAQFDAKTGGYSFDIDFKRMVNGSLAKVNAQIYRELAAMPPRDREMLRLFEYFVAGEVLDYREGLYGTLIWGDGKADIMHIHYLFEGGSAL